MMPALESFDAALAPPGHGPRRRAVRHAAQTVREQLLVYTVHWADPHKRARRPRTLRLGSFFVAVGERHTRIAAFIFTRVDSRRLRPLQPALDPVVCALAWKGLFDDRRWLAHIADTPYPFRGMPTTLARDGAR